MGVESIYIFFVVVLFVLAISDLVVGVSNDAVNFLNSAIGSKSAPFWIIMIIASLGILVGATFSSGMMEVARKSIFKPENFFFSEIMIIFLAVMLTDILLLDVFNTLGLPTSTTVSIVFELLGAAVAVSLIKIGLDDNLHIENITDYINSGKAMLIIGGILLSVVVAFTFGAIIQYITRFVFSFNFAKTLKYYGAIWGGIAVTAITYFILIKGAKGSSFIDKDTLAWIKTNTLTIIGVSFVSWTILFQIIQWLTSINILKIIVLIGTFALAMAFAGNDLVNFIGVPLAGLRSYQEFAGSGVAENALTMEVLKQKVSTPTELLLIAGLIMVVTLWFSRKARSVTETEINLSRQDEGYERFGSSIVSRAIVRVFVNMSKTVQAVMPVQMAHYINQRFDKKRAPKIHDKKDRPAFDLMRASVNLTVASIIISFATSLKLPLSTTYVTFMVAMGSSLSDGAWGRESAVYRVTGVISVIMGWFFTAIVAFTTALIFAYIINLGGVISVIILLIAGMALLIRTHFYHKKKSAQKAKIAIANTIVESDQIFNQCNTTIIDTLVGASRIYKQTIIGLSEEDRKALKKSIMDADEIDRFIKGLKDNVHFTVKRLQEDSIETGHYYVQALDYLREISHCINFIAKPSYLHIDNNHKGLSEDQTLELLNVNAEVRLMFKSILRLIQEDRFHEIEDILEKKQNILQNISQFRKKQIKRLKKGDGVTTKNSLLFLDILSETKTLVLYTVNLVKAQRDFVVQTRKSELVLN